MREPLKLASGVMVKVPSLLLVTVPLLAVRPVMERESPSTSEKPARRSVAETV